MKKFVRVMDGLKSNAGGFEYKLDEVNITHKWNPSAEDPKSFGGFNFSSEDKILRWVHRGNILYDVIIPKDGEFVLCDKVKGIYRSNKIIITNPRPLTEDLILTLCDKTTLQDNVLAQCIYIMLWKKMPNVSKYLIKNHVNEKNIDLFIKEFESYACRGDFDYNKLGPSAKELYDIMQEIKSPVLINLYISKKPYIKKLTDDKIINLTGQTGSGKSTYAQNNYNSDKYLIIDTDEILSEKRFEKATGINKELGNYFRKKYKKLPELSDNFDLIYKEILDYCKNIDKTLVIDCAQFHCCKDIKILKGKFIMIRTCIDECYERVLNRWINNHKDYTEEEFNKYKERKSSIYKWYKYTNEFLIKIDKL